MVALDFVALCIVCMCVCMCMSLCTSCTWQLDYVTTQQGWQCMCSSCAVAVVCVSAHNGCNLLTAMLHVPCIVCLPSSFTPIPSFLPSPSPPPSFFSGQPVSCKCQTDRSGGSAECCRVSVCEREYTLGDHLQAQSNVGHMTITW